MTYPKFVTKFKEAITRFAASDLNKPINDLEKRTDHLKNELDALKIEDSKVVLKVQKIGNSVKEGNLVFFDGTRWEKASAVVQPGNEMTDYSLGIALNIKGFSGNFTADIHLFGLLQGISTSFMLETGSPQVGVPYYLSALTVGTITPNQPSSSIFVGYFLTSNTFLLNMQFMHYSHIHRKIKLGPNWEADGDDIIYPMEHLPQVPLPFEGVTLTMTENYFPSYGVRYVVDQTGIRIIDPDTVEGVIGAPILTTLNDVDEQIIMYYTDPRTLQVPGVSTLESGTSNIIIENKISGSPNTSGSLILKNVPTLNKDTTTKTGSTVVKDITVNELTGELQILRGPVIEKLVGGDNISVENTNVISSAFSKEVEVPFHDIALVGAMSKRLPNTITTYIEHTNLRETAAIYTAILPKNISSSVSLKAFITVFGTLTVSSEEDVVLEVNYSLLGAGGLASEVPNKTTLTIPILERNRLIRTMVLEIPGQQLKASGTFSMEIRRPTGNEYENPIGVQQATLTYGLR